MIIVDKLGKILEGLYGLRVTANGEAYLESMMLDDDNLIDFTPEDEDD